MCLNASILWSANSLKIKLSLILWSYNFLVYSQIMPFQQSSTAILPLAGTFSGRPWNNRSHRGRRGKSRIMEQIDYFLEGMGLYRKQTARDGTCLFRCVSEQLFYSQCFHYSVRLSCIHFMERNRCLFPDKIGGERFEEHARRLRSPREWAGHWEMQAMSLLYK